MKNLVCAMKLQRLSTLHQEMQEIFTKANDTPEIHGKLSRMFSDINKPHGNYIKLLSNKKNVILNVTLPLGNTW